MNGRAEKQRSTVFLSSFGSVTDWHGRGDPLQKLKNVLRGTRQAKLLTEKDGTINTGLDTQFVIAVIIPGDLFGFAG